MKKKKNAVVNYSILSTRISTISSGDTKHFVNFKLIRNLGISETADNTKISIVNQIIMNCLCVNAFYDSRLVNDYTSHTDKNKTKYYISSL